MFFDDLYWNIFYYLEYIELRKMRLVCQQYNNIIMNKKFLRLWCKNKNINFNENMNIRDLRLIFNKNEQEYPLKFSEDFLLNNYDIFNIYNERNSISNHFLITKKVLEKYKLNNYIGYPSKELFLKFKEGHIPSNYLPVKFSLKDTIIMDLNDEVLERYELWKYSYFLFNEKISYKMKIKYFSIILEYSKKTNDFPIKEKIPVNEEEMKDFGEFYSLCLKYNIISEDYLGKINEECNPDLLIKFPKLILFNFIRENEKMTTKHFESIEDVISEQYDFEHSSVILENLESTIHLEFFIDFYADSSVEGIYLAMFKNPNLTYELFQKYRKEILKDIHDDPPNSYTLKMLNYLNNNEDVKEEGGRKRKPKIPKQSIYDSYENILSKKNFTEGIISKRIFNIYLMGDSGVGKTTSMKRIITGEFEKEFIPTTEIEIYKVSIITNHDNFFFNIYDGPIDKLDIDAYIIMFDISRKETYENINYWIDKIQSPYLPIVLCGNKRDVFNYSRIVKDSLNDNVVQYYEISAKTRYGFENVFECVLKNLYSIIDLKISEIKGW